VEAGDVVATGGGEMNTLEAFDDTARAGCNSGGDALMGPARAALVGVIGGAAAGREAVWAAGVRGMAPEARATAATRERAADAAMSTRPIGGRIQRRCTLVDLLSESHPLVAGKAVNPPGRVLKASTDRRAGPQPRR
jgi:hypothetical protein